MKAVLWLLMMAVWLAALLFGVWWLWPSLQRATPGAELVAAGMWVIIGFAAWMLALSLGWQRFWGGRGRRGL